MKNYYETIKETKSDVEGTTMDVPKGTELQLVQGAFGGHTDGYAVKDPVKLGLNKHDATYHYAYVDNMAVFAARHMRPPVKAKSADWQETANKWRVTIAGQDFDYYTGSGIDKSPTYDDVMQCLLSDSDALTQSFEDWASEFGYDTDSRKAYATYEACGDNARKLLKTGIDLNAERVRLQDQ